MGLIKALSPTTIKRFTIFEPTTLPMAIALFPLSAADILTASYGALVPKATMVRPITEEGIRNLRAISEAPSTK